MKDELLKQANTIEACATDARKGTPVYGAQGDFTREPEPQIISLANGLEAVAKALRALAQEQGDA